MRTVWVHDDVCITQRENGVRLEQHPVGPGQGILSKPQLLQLHSAGAAPSAAVCQSASPWPADVLQ